MWQHQRRSKILGWAFCFIAIAIAPTAARAQVTGSTITGIVKDTSGAVLPGVTVEAASPALIEKVKSTVTDGSGAYRIVDLRPGTYTVTFSLTGFGTTKREQFELPGDFVATLNIDMKIGGVEESITVSGESPIVDLQSAKKTQTLDTELIQATPTARGYAAVMLLMPSAIVSGGAPTNVQLSPGMIVFGGRGGRGNEGQSQIDGLGTGAAINGGGVSGYGQLETAQEVVMTAAGGLGESEQGGPIINFIPKAGGNTFQNHFYGSNMSGWMQSSNYTPALQAAGLTTPQQTLYLAEDSLSNGGPLKQDRVWFFFNTRYSASANTLPGIYYNLNAGNPNAWLYAPDTSRAVNNKSLGSINPTLRLTVQATPKNKLNLYWDPGSFRFSDYPQVGGINGPTAGAPETGTVSGGTGWKQGSYSRMETARWTNTATPRLLLEAGVSAYQQNWNGREVPGNNRSLIPVTEQCTAGCPNNGNIQGLVYRAQGWNASFMEPVRWNMSATYVTGTHSVKAGYQGAFYWEEENPNGNNQDLSYRFNNGVPNQLTEQLWPYHTDSRTQMNALYVQDTWTRGKLTLQGALRYDHAWSYYVPQQLGPTVFLPTPIQFPLTQGVIGYNDIDPRFGAAYDLFGNGKTAIKVNVGRYLEMAVNGNGNYSALVPSARIPTSVTRTWTDANKNFSPDCNLQNPLANGECGQISNLNFGQSNAPPSLSYDPNILQGWYNRPADWIIGVTVQQQVLSRMSVSIGYTRRWLEHFTVTDNLATQPSDYSQFNIVAPSDPRLPGGGGYTVSGLYDVNPNKFGQVNNLVTYSTDISQMYNGIDVNVSARLRSGFQFQGGLSSGERVTDYCGARTQFPGLTGTFSTGSEVPAFSPTNPYCHYAPGITTRYTGTGTYTVPKIDTLFSAVMTSSPGLPLAANWTIPSSLVAQTLGRPLAAGATSNITVNLLQPGQLYSDRVNELDLRLAKNLRFGGERLNLALDLLNALNLNTILSPNQAFIPGGAWLTPTGTQTPIMTARTAKFTVQYDF